MEPTDFDMDTSLYIVPRRQEGFSQVREHNALLETPWSNTSHALVPIRTSEAIVTTISDESMERAKKRYRLEDEQANAALETLSTYQDTMKSPRSTMWSEAIETELKPLHSMNTWTALAKPPKK